MTPTNHSVEPSTLPNVSRPTDHQQGDSSHVVETTKMKGHGGYISNRSIYISVAEEMNPRRRSNMEDKIVIHGAGEWGAPDPNMSFMAVYDGHGGRDIVDFLEHGMTYHMARELEYDGGGGGDGGGDVKNDDDDDDDKTNRNNNSNNDVNLQTRIERAFLMTDIHSRQAGLLTSGATVALCLITPDYENHRVQLVTANVGDARVVVCLSPAVGTAVRLTEDHNPQNTQEVKRVEEAGGFLYRNRVLGVLAITRSLGDQVLKPYVIGHPFVKETYVSLLRDNNNNNNNSTTRSDERSCPPFMILACDGLWDVFTDQEAVDLVLNCNVAQREYAGQMLVNEAMRRGTTDNVSVIVAFFTTNSSN